MIESDPHPSCVPAFAERALDLVRSLYRDTGDPLLTAPLVKVAIDAIPSEFLPNNLAALRLHRFLGYILVNHHTSESILLARDWLRKTRTIAQEFTEHSPELIAEDIKARWLEAITFKQAGNPTTATEICEDVLMSHNVPVDLEIRLRRELAIINNDRSGFEHILSRSEDLASNSIERCHNLRRALEYFCLNGNLARARDIVGDAIQSFRLVYKSLDPIYHVQMARAVYIYFSLVRDSELAEHAFNFALRNSTLRSLHGQEKLLLRLKHLPIAQDKEQFLG